MACSWSGFSDACFFNLFYLETWLDSDMAAEMIFSKLLAEEGKWLATESWYYSTEFRVLYTQILMEPLFYCFFHFPKRFSPICRWETPICGICF